MQSFPFWQQLPAVPAYQTPLEIAAQQAAIDQATWTERGFYAQLAAVSAAIVVLLYTHFSTKAVREQTAALMRQAADDRAERDQRSYLSASEFLGFLQANFTMPEHYPADWEFSNAVAFGLDQWRRAISNPILPQLTDLRAVETHGLAFASRIRDPECAQQWLEVVDCLGTLERESTAALNTHNDRTPPPDPGSAFDIITDFEGHVERAKVRLDHDRKMPVAHPALHLAIRDLRAAISALRDSLRQASRPRAPRAAPANRIVRAWRVLWTGSETGRVASGKEAPTVPPA